MAGPKVAQLDVMHTLVAAGTDDDFFSVFTLPGSWLIKAARIIPLATSTGDASNYAVLTLTNGATTIGAWSTLSTSDGTLTEGTDAAFPLDGTGSDLVIAQNDVIKLAKVKTGTGVAVHCIVSLYLEQRPL